MRPRARLCCLTAAVLFGALATGCGSGSSPESVDSAGSSDQVGEDQAERQDHLGMDTALSDGLAWQDVRVDQHAPDGVWEDVGKDAQDVADDVEPGDGPFVDIFIAECCDSSVDCMDNMQCYVIEGGGVCRLIPEAGKCWDDIDCGEGGKCEGSVMCACDVDCAYEGMGECVTEPYPGCCKQDSDCVGGLKCVGGAFASGGWCAPYAEGDQCYTTTECPVNHFCFGQQLCSCNDTCDIEPGFCSPMAGFCCESDADCETGFKCTEEGSLGVCEPIPPFEGKCWRDDDCEAGEECVGASACPCNADCDSVDMYGDCMPDNTPCGCLFDEECQPGEVCAVLPGGGGVCKPAPALGDCWDEGDCFEMSQTCEGETLCPCDAMCDVPDMLGKCAPLPSGCCNSDADCGPTQVCRGIWPGSKLPGACKDDLSQLIGCPYPGGCCWDDTDCAEGKKCTDGSVCGCIALLYVQGACAEDQTGFCE